MKRFLGLLALVFLINGCDDGDIQVESFDFSNAETHNCFSQTNDFFIYKINAKETLIVQLNEADNFINEVTPAGTPRTVAIGTEAKVIYRLYDGNLSTASICSAIPASSPNVIEEWNATGGTIEIVTNAVNPINEETGATVITGFSHTITFKNITFDTGHGQQTNDAIVFGTYVTPAIQPAPFENIDINECPDNNLLFKYSGTQALTLDLDQATFDDLFANEVTPINEPKTAYISAANKLNYRVFDTGLTLDYFCAATTPATPALTELWEGETGVQDTSGIIEVATTTNGPNFVHTVRFKNVKYKNAGSGLEFSLGTDYLFGDFITGG